MTGIEQGAAPPQVEQTAPAPGDVMTATPEAPAVLTVPVPQLDAGAGNKTSSVVLSVTGYTPPEDGSLKAVVRLKDQANGEEQILGDFGVFPADTGFQADTPDAAQRFSFDLPTESLAAGAPDTLRLKIELVPILGDAGRGGSLEFGGVEISPR